MKEYSSLLMRRDISDEELAQIIERAKSDDADALAKLCQHIYARVYSYIFYRVKQREDAEDLTSEIILKMIKALKEQKRNFRAWIYRIAGNALIDFYRKRSVRRETSLDEFTQDIPDQKDYMPRDVLTKDRLREAITYLTKEQGDVITMKFVQELDNEEVAKIMGKSVGAIKVLQYRALKSLKEYFRKKGYEVAN